MKKKIQTVMLAAAGIIIITAAAAVIIVTAAPPLLSRSIETSYEQGKPTRAAELSFRLMKFFPWTSYAREASLRMLSMREGQQTMVITGHNFTMKTGSGGRYLPEAFHGDLFPAVQSTAHMQTDALWTCNIYEAMGRTSAAVGEFEQAADYYSYALECFLERGMKFRALSIYMSLFDIAIALQRPADARDHILQAAAIVEKGSITEAEVLARKGMLKLELDELDDAEELFYRAMDLAEIGAEKASMNEIRPDIIITAEAQEGYRIAQRGLMLLDALKHPQRSTKLHGTITAEGVPMDMVTVTLVPFDSPQQVISPHEARMRYPQEVTGSDGSYTFQNIAPGSYSFILAFSPHQLADLGAFDIPESVTVTDGESLEVSFSLNNRLTMTAPEGLVSLPYGEALKFSWEPISGADSYGIHLVYFSGPEDEPYKQSAGIDIDRTAGTAYEINTASRESRSPLGIHSSDRIIPAAVMGPYHPGAHITFRVTAYDQHQRVITDSEGLVYDRGANYPLWHITGPADESLLLSGDRALLSGDIEEAVKRYKASTRETAAASREALMKYLEMSDRLQ